MKYPLAEDCTACSLRPTCTQVVWGHGPANLSDTLAMLIAEAPGQNEDMQGEPLVGKTGDETQWLMARNGIPWERIYRTNIVKCFISSRVRVYTSNGYVPLKNIQVGDLVLTHKGRFKKVLSRVHDLPLIQRKAPNELWEIVIQGSNSTKKLRHIVTPDHLFLTDSGFVKAEKLAARDRIKCLAETCIICGNTYFKDPKRFDIGENTCSQICHNRSAASKSSKAISRSMKRQYQDGTRDRYKITKAANNKTRRLIKSGEFHLFHQTKEQREQGRLTIAKAIEIKNGYRPQGGCIGFGEEEVAQFLLSENIEFIHQFSISRYNFDFLLIEHNLIVEVDNPVRQCQAKVQERQALKDELAIKHGFDILHVPSIDPIQPISRLLKNHSHEYQFVNVPIVVSRPHKAKRQEYLYSLEVEDDESFVADGMVCHNCRPISNRDPKPIELATCTPWLIKELEMVRSKIIIAMGRFATRYFIPDANMEVCNGIPYEIGDYIVIPVYHVAAGLHNPSTMLAIQAGFQTVRDVLAGKRPPRHIEDEFAGRERYFELRDNDLL